ncbi:MAG: hypothetical protein HFG59_05040 [Lachnospiraceae bacterium]|nr:hypothetical protein [Lachnospiraceae bacterium]
MVLAWMRFAAAAGLLLLGLVFEVLAVFGVNRFRRALNRMHAAAMGDTLGILFVMLGLMVLKGWSMDSLKLFLVVAFFWIASPVSGHMISRLEAMTDEDLGEILVMDKTLEAGGQETRGQKAENQEAEGQRTEAQEAENQEAEGQKTETQKAENQEAEGQRTEAQEARAQENKRWEHEDI